MRGAHRKLLVLVGARPNFVKVARLRPVAEAHGGWQVVLVHSGQHSDARMSDVFLEQLRLEPDHWLGVGQGDPAARVAGIMAALAPVVLQERPDAVMVVGDVDGTLAGAVTANKLGVPLVHLESGLRSGDLGMPEEVNRILTDRLADVHLVTEASGLAHLQAEGLDPARAHLVGNTMVDTLVAFDARIQADDVMERLGIGTGGHALVTMHRPATVDDPDGLSRMIALLAEVAKDHRVVFPVHPRTRDRLVYHGLLERFETLTGLLAIGPLDYFAFQKLLASAAVVITDSGGVQEETTFRRVPCITLRPHTERPVTITEGTNRLAPAEPAAVRAALDHIAAHGPGPARIPHLWDGRATERVFAVLDETL